MEDNPEPSRKRRRLSGDNQTDHKKLMQETLARSISPPPLRHTEIPAGEATDRVRSPFQLTSIRDLPPSSNIDTVSLKDILGDPLISECWDFNYLHDLNFLMDAFDEDVRDMVKVRVVHGFWKKEDTQRLRLQEQALKYKNLKLLTAYMPEMFGTHHTKMLAILRHDEMAQIIIHTANMIPFDWTNMTQGLWRSPLLPRLNANPSNQTGPIGHGAKFKLDFLNYLKAYDTKRTLCKPLIDQLVMYDFSEIRAALIGSVPGRHDVDADAETAWGWAGLEKALKSVPVRQPEPEIVIQVSSIASLGATDKWLNQTFFKTLRVSKNAVASRPKYHIMFPTADEVRRSLNGYSSGSAIHTKIQGSTQVKQLAYLQPLLCHWAGDGAQHVTEQLIPILDAGRKRAAPHIKTYTRFADKTKTSIDWMLLTSANLSKQAWGEGTNSAGEVRICSYELGVLVWPELMGDNASMVPTFKTDKPQEPNSDGLVRIAMRMPYDLPLVRYSEDDEPWCATKSYNEADWKGQTYNLE